jgi:hypothetical protein
MWDIKMISKMPLTFETEKINKKRALIFGDPVAKRL